MTFSSDASGPVSVAVRPSRGLTRGLWLQPHGARREALRAAGERVATPTLSNSTRKEPK